MIELTPATIRIQLILYILTVHNIIVMYVCVIII
jgi:hypothetical protein